MPDKNSEVMDPSTTSNQTPRKRRQGDINGPQTIGSPPSAAAPSPLGTTCQQLVHLQRRRRFCIASQSRIDRPMQSEIAICLGYTNTNERRATTIEKSDFKKLFAIAGKIIAAVEADKPIDQFLPDQGDPRCKLVLDAMPLIRISQSSRGLWDERRELFEQEMRALAKTLPVWPWVRDNAKGTGELGLARIVGEAPLIGEYATHEKLWKRLGVAVIDGARQQQRSDPDEAMLHGYRPSRRAELWSVCSDTMFRAQWRGGEDDAPGYPIGPYGAVYAYRKAATLQRINDTESLPFADPRKWTRKRADNDARRVMSKAFLKDLWRVWRGMDAIYPARWSTAQEQQAA